MSAQELSHRSATVHNQTRAEILLSTGSSLTLCGASWGLLSGNASTFHHLALGLTAAWAIAILWLNRHRVPKPPPTPPDALAASGIEHYRAILQDRLSHITASAGWRGPLFLSLAILAWSFTTRLPNEPNSFLRIAPFLGMALLWTILAFRQIRIARRDLLGEIERLPPRLLD